MFILPQGEDGGGSQEQRSRLITNQDRLNNTTDRLMETRRLAEDTEVGV